MNTQATARPWRRTCIGSARMGIGDAERLTESPNAQKPSSWHPSGRYSRLRRDQRSHKVDVMILPLEGDDASGWKPGKPTAFLNGAYVEFDPKSHPGHWRRHADSLDGARWPDDAPARSARTLVYSQLRAQWAAAGAGDPGGIFGHLGLRVGVRARGGKRDSAAIWRPHGRLVMMGTGRQPRQRVPRLAGTRVFRRPTRRTARLRSPRSHSGRRAPGPADP